MKLKLSVLSLCILLFLAGFVMVLTYDFAVLYATGQFQKAFRPSPSQN